MFYGHFYTQDCIYFFISLRTLIGKTKNVKVDIEKILQRSADNDDMSMFLSFGDSDDIIMANRDRSVSYIRMHYT